MFDWQREGSCSVHLRGRGMFWSWEDVKLNRPDLDYGFIFCFCFVFVFRFVLSVTKGEHTSYGRPFPHERGVYRVVHCPFGDIVNHWGGGICAPFIFGLWLGEFVSFLSLIFRSW